MPSDPPPNQPPSSGTAGTEGVAGGEARAGAGRGGAGERAGAFSADVRRYAATGGGEQRKSSLSNSFALAMIVAFLVVAIVMIQQGPSLLQSPRVLPPLPAGVAPNLGVGTPTVAPPTATATTTGPLVEPNSALARAYGMSALNSASRQARRIGLAVAVAAECGVRTAYWGNEVREGVAKEQAERYPAFEDNARTKEMLRRFIAQEFIIGQKSAGSLFAERGRQAACEDIRYSPDYRAAVNAADQAGIR